MAGNTEPTTNLANVAIDLTLGVLAIGAAGLRAVPDLAAKLPVRAAGAALVASERAQRDYEALLARGAEVRTTLSGFLSSRLLGPPIVEDEPAEVDPFDLLLVDDPAEEADDQDGVSGPLAPRVPLVVVVDAADAYPEEEQPEGQPAGDLPLADFDQMSLGALRGRARQLDIPELEMLLDRERTHGRREGVLALLETRIAQLHQERSTG